MPGVANDGSTPRFPVPGGGVEAAGSPMSEYSQRQLPPICNFEVPLVLFHTMLFENVADCAIVQFTPATRLIATLLSAIVLNWILRVPVSALTRGWPPHHTRRT